MTRADDPLPLSGERKVQMAPVAGVVTAIDQAERDEPVARASRIRPVHSQGFGQPHQIDRLQARDHHEGAKLAQADAILDGGDRLGADADQHP